MAVRAPKHLYIIGIIVLLWDIMGVVDFTMTLTENEAYLEMAELTAEQVEFSYNLDTLHVVLWGIAVISGVLGMLALLMRRAAAVDILLISMLGAISSNAYTVLFTDCFAVFGKGAAGMLAAVVALAVGVWFYAKSMRQKGVLT